MSYVLKKQYWLSTVNETYAQVITNIPHSNGDAARCEHRKTTTVKADFRLKIELLQAACHSNNPSPSFLELFLSIIKGYAFAQKNQYHINSIFSESTDHLWILKIALHS